MGRDKAEGRGRGEISRIDFEVLMYCFFFLFFSP